MIAGSINQAGFKDEQPSKKPPTYSPNGFVNLLRRSKTPQFEKPGRMPEPLPLRGPNSYQKKAPEPLFDPRAKNSFQDQRAARNQDTGKDPKYLEHIHPAHGQSNVRQTADRKNNGPSKEDESKIEKEALNAHDQSGLQAVLQEADPKIADPTEAALAANVPAMAMTRTDGETEVGKTGGRASNMVHIGMAAYNLAAHAPGEAALTEELGIFPPGAHAPEGDPIGKAASQLLPKGVFQEKDPEIDMEMEAGKKINAIDILNLTRKSTDRETVEAEAILEELNKQNSKSHPDVVTQTSMAKHGEKPLGASLLALMGGVDKKLHQPAKTAEGLEHVVKAMKHSEAQGTVPFGEALTKGSSNMQGMNAIAADPYIDQAQQILDRIADQARWMIRGNRSEVTMKLKPEELGEMRMKVVQEDGSITVDLTVDNLAVKKLIESRMEELQDRMQSENTGQEQFTFNVDIHKGNDSELANTLSLPPHETSILAGITKVNDTDSVLGREQPLWGRSGVGIYI